MKRSTYLRAALKSILEDGWQITSHNATDDGSTERIWTIEQAVKAVFSVDECAVYFSKTVGAGEARRELSGWIFTVLQGPDETYKDGEEIIADYTTNLSLAIEGLDERLKAERKLI